MKLKYLIVLLCAFTFTTLVNAQDIASEKVKKKGKEKKEKVHVEKEKKEKVKVNSKVAKLNKIQEKFNFDSLLAAQTAATITYESQSESDLKFMKVENQAKTKKAILDAKIDKARKNVKNKAFENRSNVQSKADVRIEKIQSRANRKKEKIASTKEKDLIKLKAIEDVEGIKYKDYIKVKKDEFQLEADINIQEAEEKSAEIIAKSRTKLNKARLKALGK
ncbi:MAG: hypothetical protein HN600_01395 [Bacteroidetes bacterium]|nr:hypothetical protein [Bacteroidota bacterium]